MWTFQLCSSNLNKNIERQACLKGKRKSTFNCMDQHIPALLPNLRAGYISHIFTANRKPKFYMNAFTELHCLIYHMASTGEACKKRIKPFPAEHLQDCLHESACYTVALCCILRDSTKSVVEICHIQGIQGTTFGPLYSPLCTTKSSGG